MTEFIQYLEIIYLTFCGGKILLRGLVFFILVFSDIIILSVGEGEEERGAYSLQGKYQV